MLCNVNSSSAHGLPPRWFSKSTLVVTILFLALTIPCTTAWRRHRHKHGGRIPISNRLHDTYANTWKAWEESNRHKRQHEGAYYPSNGEQEAGPWTDWRQTTACSRTCGGGVFEEARSCETEGACTGNDKRYSSCNVEECPEDSMDFRAEQCARYNTVPFEGQYYSWIPYTKGPRKCELNCQPNGERFYYRHKSKVVDGTRCNVEFRDVCVDGECVPVGCDLIIGSGTEEDKCRVCGGDGTSCTTISGIVDTPIMTSGYNDIVLIPQGATNILVEEVQSSNNYLAIRNASGHYYLNGNWKIDFPNPMKFAGTTIYYERKAQGASLFAPEIIRSLGPTNESLYLVLLYQETNPGIKYEFSVPKDVKETESIIYEWRMNGWGDCSVSCGGGHMNRNVTCVRASDYKEVDGNLELCDPRLTPASNKSCNEQPCQSSWQNGNWTPCSSDCGSPGVQYRYVFCGQFVSEGRLAITNDSSCEETDGSKPEETRECNVGSNCPTYHIAEWSNCDKLCGTGKQTREVTCHIVTNSTTDVLEDSDCSGDKPEEGKDCEAAPCKGTDWVVSEWSKCKSCGASVESRKAFCITTEGDVVIDVLCGLHRKPNLTQDCEKEYECSNRWYASEWSDCSENCGEGVRTRHVFCGSFEDDDLVSIVDDEKCDKETKLSGNETCIGEGECENKWFTAPFGKCSKTCGGGEQRRLIFCFNNVTNEKYTNCDKITKPFEKEGCNTQACSTDELMGIAEEEDEELPWCELEEEEETDGQVTVDETEADKLEVSTKPTDVDSMETTTQSSKVDANITTLSDTVDPEMTTQSGDVGTETTMGIESTTQSADVDMESTTQSAEDATKTTTLSSVTGPTESTTQSDEVVSTEMTEPDDQESGDDDDGSTEGSTEGSSEGDEGSGKIPYTTGEGSSRLIKKRIKRGISDDEDDFDGLGSGDGIVDDEEDGSGSEENIHLEEIVEVAKAKTDAPTTTTIISPKKTTIEAKMSTEVPIEMTTEGSGIIDPDDDPDYSGEEPGDVTDDKDVTDPTTTIEKEQKCKPRPTISSDESEFGSCSDGKTPADGPFKEGCEVFETCQETEHGCCPDDISPAQGEKFLGCRVVSICDSSLFRCCSDNFTAATGPMDEGCDNLVEFHCKENKFGCCPDGTTTATGKNFAGCPTDAECEGSADCQPCDETEYGCCPDGATIALGDDFEGCIDGSGEGSGTEMPDDGVTEEILPDCSRTTFGCCVDNFTAAHGENFEGCCLASPFGCCPDHISIARGPNFQGCGCEFSVFGCCPDNETVARGEENAGCGCQYTEFDCCPDNHTPAVGANQTGCPCNTYEFGCCPDGVSIADGYDKEGCGCTHTEFGCCQDSRTPAEGPDGEGCSCEASQFGCCADGITSAAGKLFEGCEEEAPIIPGEVCGFEKDRGPCRIFAVKFYFDISYGGCTRFWYGGCEGNLNRFTTEQECEDTCVTPEGLDACRLPPVSGPCTGSELSWFHDSETQTCNTFEYRGCRGNKNRFGTKEECQAVCILPEKTDVCLLNVRPGPCRGNYSRWYYDQTVDKCISFTYGGCKGNSNNFLSENECMQRCIRGRSQDICTLPKSSGLCDETLPRWYYDFTETRCMPFYYTGCDGNANRFIDRGECEATCTQDDAATLTTNACMMPKLPGPCSNLTERYYYDIAAGRCQQFLYGGCSGNSNNYATLEKCQMDCEDRGISTETKDFPTDSCFLPHEQGTCGEFAAMWYYDSINGACKQFLYSGCAGNLNRFKTRQECDNKCGEVQDVCKLPVVIGPCSGSQKQYFYEMNINECLPFDYSGCLGNRNRFDSLHLCHQRCQTAKTPVESPYSPHHSQGPELPNICLLPMYTGNCRAAIPNWYFDQAHNRCIGFTYGGCSGNANRFQSVELCERQCGKYRNRDACNQQVDAGGCEGSYFTKWYHDSLERTCKLFHYSGCEGNGNRFSTRNECESECIYIDTLLPPGNTTSETNIAICELEKDEGPCKDGYKRWYFSVETGKCEPFIYGGCGGNLNKFKGYKHCAQYCHAASLKHQQHVETTSIYPGDHTDPCAEQNAHCRILQCNYGTTKRVDGNNCERCECFDPCENMICLQGSQCSVELIQSRTETYEEVRFEAYCREAIKTGTCPPLSGEISKCDQECESDARCSGLQKCCYNGCAYVCVNPIQERPATEEPASVPEPLVGTPATITYADTKVSVEENDVANLVCQADGIPTPAIAWFRDGQKLEVSGNTRFQMSLDYSLRIMNVVPSDRGYYRCVANNGLGSPAERDVELEILNPTPRELDIIPPQDPNPVVTLGSPVILWCWHTGWPVANFSWWRGSTMMPRTSEQYETFPLGGMRINIVTLRDLGPYTCHAYNGFGKPASNTFTLRGLGPIRIMSPSDRDFLQYIVHPPKLPTFAPQSTSTRTTEFPAIRPDQRPYVPPYYSPYPPVVTSSRPPAYAPVKLNALIHTNTTQFAPISDIQLPCEVQGDSLTGINWYHNDVRLENTDKIHISAYECGRWTFADCVVTITIKNAEETDAGTYTCEVTGQYGAKSSSSTTVSVQGVYVHPSCTDNPFFANCKLIVKAEYCTNTYYARFCCRSCTIAGQLPIFGPHLQEKLRRRRK